MAQWSRGCGSGGIGYAGGVNEYRNGVLQANWVEDSAGNEFKATGKHTLGFGAPFAGNTTQRMSYNEYGKTGADLEYLSQRHDQEIGKDGSAKADVLFRHGKFSQPQETCFGALNQLTYAEPRVGDPKVQAHLWSGHNKQDTTVTRNTTTLSLTQRKAEEWGAPAGIEAGFKSTSRSSQYAAALPAAEKPEKQGTTRPLDDHGDLSSTGRRPLGPHRDECDKDYRVIGLRDTYGTFLNAPKHVLPVL